MKRSHTQTPVRASAVLNGVSVFGKKAFLPVLQKTFLSTLVKPSVIVQTQQPFSQSFSQGVVGGKLQGRRGQAGWRGRANDASASSVCQGPF